MDFIYQFNSFLEHTLDESNALTESMKYSLMSSSKRIRPLLLINLLIDLQGNCNNGFYIASGIEMIHTYSLIHDDLPCMDNDDYRRGKLSNHKQFNEAIALLSGDALLTEGFNMITKENCTDYQKVNILKLFSQLAGYQGMCLGQMMDLNNINNIDQIITTEKLKTGCLLSLPLQCGCILSNRNDLLDTFKEIGFKLGIAFQIQDDILDVTKSKEELGKSTSDLNNNKITFVSELGLQKSKELYISYYQEIIEKLEKLNCINTLNIIKNLINREK